MTILELMGCGGILAGCLIGVIVGVMTGIAWWSAGTGFVGCVIGWFAGIAAAHFTIWIQCRGTRKRK